MLSLIWVLLAFVFVLLNAFFVAAEFSLVKLRSSRVQTIQKSKGIKGRMLYQVHRQLDAYLSACQLGITLASLGLGWIGEPAFAKLLENVFYYFNIYSEKTIQLISFAVAFSLISFLHIVLGELMPKSVAIRASEKVSLWTAIPLYLFYWGMYPFIWLLNHTATFLLRIFKLSSLHSTETNYSTDEIKLILKSSHAYESKLEKENKIDSMKKESTEMLIRMIEFTHLEAVDVMRPLEEMISLDKNDSLDFLLNKIKQYRYTRYPVHQDSMNDIIGILHTKDLFFTLKNSQGDFKLQSILRAPIKIQRNTPAIEILEKFRQGATHFALVYHGKKLIGFITLDNLLQSVIGKIGDEFHLATEDWIKLSDGSYLIKGSAPVYVIEKLLDIDLSAYPADTVAGLLLNSLEKMPIPGEEWQHPQFKLRVKKIKGPRILEVVMIPTP